MPLEGNLLECYVKHYFLASYLMETGRSLFRVVSGSIATKQLFQICRRENSRIVEIMC